MSLRLDAGLEETERRVAAAAGGTDAWLDAVDRLVAECHPAQRDFVLDPSRHIAALCGRGGGKTVGGMVRFIRRMLTTPGARCFYLAKFRKHAEDLIWLPLKETLYRLGFVPGQDVVYNETKLTATITRNGARLSLFGADKPGYVESLRGQSYHEVGIDEAALHGDRLLQTLTHAIIGPRLLGALWLIGTPGPVPKGLFYETTRRGSKLARLWADRDLHPGFRGWSLHKWSLRSAIESTADRPIEKLVHLYEIQQTELADQQLGDDNPVKRREYDGEWAADETARVYSGYRIHDDAGALWNQWDPERVGPMQIAKLPPGFDDWIHVIGMDPGYDDPTAINVFAFSPTDPRRTVYHRLCWERTKMYAQSIAHVLIGEALSHERPAGIIGAIGEWPSGMIADPSHQMARAILAELANVYSLHFEQAEKTFSYKIGAIEVLNGEFIDGRIKILRGSELEAQLADLQWDESRTGARIERQGQPNHSTDSLVYARMLLSRFLHAQGEELAPEPPPTEPPMPDARALDDYSALFAEDYGSLLG